MTTTPFVSAPTVSGRRCIQSTAAILWIVLCAQAPIAQAAGTIIAPQCQLTPEQTLRCTSGDGGPILDFTFDVTGSGAPPPTTTYTKAEQRAPQTLAIKTTAACGDLNINTAPDPSGGTRLSASARCSAPARVCMNARVSGPDVILRSGIAYIQGRSATLGIQADERVSTEIKPAEKLIRFCTDPAHQQELGWNLNLFAGTPDDVRTAFQRIPAPILNQSGAVVGLSKTSPAVKEGYLFIDLTENNADKVLPIVKRSGFPYVLIYGSTWASSLGSYEFNKKNYPNGLEGLKKVVQAANAMGIKVGLHTLTSFVAKADPLVPQVARNGLLKDDRSTLYADIDASAQRVVAADALTGFPNAKAFYGNVKSGFDLLIDDEIVSCPSIERSARGVLSACKRGLYGTLPTAHRAGTPIHHLAERYGAYLADLRSPLKAQLAERISKVIDGAGIDMVYFDGGEVGTANGEAPWFVAEQQIAILKQVHRPLLVEGSGVTPRLWPYLTRIVDDDFATLATIDFLDVHKIGESRKALQNILMPDNLGWLGLLKETPSYPATTPEEIATYVARSLALDTPLAIETRVDDLDGSPYTESMLTTLAFGNRALKSNNLSNPERSRLAQGMWFHDSNSPRSLRPVRQIRFAMNAPPAIGTVIAAPTEQGVALRIRRVHDSDSKGSGNVVITDIDPAELKSLPQPPSITDKNRGLLAGSVVLNKGGDGGGLSSFVQLATDKSPNRQTLDLSGNRTLLVDYDYTAKDSPPQPAHCTVANLQLQDNRGQYRDYLLNVQNGTGQSAVLDYERDAGKILTDLRPAAGNYTFKPALYGFDFKRVIQLNVRWMRTCGTDATLRINKITMLAEQPAMLSNVVLRAGTARYPVTADLATGETLDVLPSGTIFRCRGRNCRTSSIPWPSARAVAGQEIKVQASGKATAEITLGLLGDELQVK